MLDFVHFQGEKGPLYSDIYKSFFYRSRIRAHVEKLFHIYLRKSVKTCREKFRAQRIFFLGMSR
jgi:hypothetical protein